MELARPQAALLHHRRELNARVLGHSESPLAKLRVVAVHEVELSQLPIPNFRFPSPNSLNPIPSNLRHLEARNIRKPAHLSLKDPEALHAAILLRFAKESGIPVILIGHITKEGSIAGPKILEHIVDVVLQFEGDNRGSYRILRSIKNRFGSTSELAVFEMTGKGLRQVANPSELLIPMHEEGLSGTAVAAMLDGTRPFLFEVQALVSSAVYGTAQRSATGFDTRRLNMLLAVLERRAGFKLAQKDVFLNMAGGLRVSDPACDMAVVAAVLSSNFDFPIPADNCFAGEIGLSGEIRPVAQPDRRVAEAARLGFKKIFVSSYTSLDTKAKGIEVVKVADVPALVRALFQRGNQ